jgi:cytochrome P450
MTSMYDSRLHDTLDTATYDLFSQSFLADPLPTLRRMRTEHPVYWHPLLNAWVLTRYDDIQVILRDHRFSSERSGQLGNGAPPHMADQLAVCNRFFSLLMVFVDPPRHTVLRSLLGKAFTAKTVEGLRPFAERVVDEILDGVLAKGKMDVVRDLAGPLPAVVIAKMLGVPNADVGKFKALTNDLFALVNAPVATEDVIATSHRGVVGLLGYFAALIAARRRSMTDDLLSQLIRAEEQGEVLTDEELVATSAMLLVAGHETTTHLISNATLALVRNRAELETLRARPDVIPSAVEELLRYDGAAMALVRRALEDVVIGDRRIAAGDYVFGMLQAANHDPAHFFDPDRLDVLRKDVRHVAFGQGIHYCVGAPLARLETQIALRKILERLTRLRLETEDLQWIPSIAIHGVVSLPVVFDARREERESAPPSLRDVDLPASGRVPVSIPPPPSGRVPIRGRS